jgi:hypothetical protein
MTLFYVRKSTILSLVFSLKCTRTIIYLKKEITRHTNNLFSFFKPLHFLHFLFVFSVLQSFSSPSLFFCIFISVFFVSYEFYV